MATGESSLLGTKVQLQTRVARRPDDSAVWPLIVPALAALLVRFATGAHPVDDAFITFRYARNLGQGLGLVYNAGEWVLGTTAPLWAGILAVIYRLGGTDLPTAAWIVSSFCDAASAALLAWLCIRVGHGRRGAVLVGCAWAMNPLSVAYAVGGMETSLFVLTVLCSLVLAATGHHARACVLAGFSFLVRPEGLLVAGAGVFWAWRKHRRFVPGPMFAAGVPIVSWMALTLAVYGTLVPQTVLAKQVAYRSTAPWDSLFILLFHAGQPGWSNFFPGLLPTLLAFNIMLFGLVALSVLGWSAIRRWPGSVNQLAWQPFALFAALYFLFHAIGGVRGARLFPWYLVPLNSMYLLVAGVGARALAGGRVATGLAVVLVLWQLPAIDWTRPFLPAGFDLRREALYLKVADDLRDMLPPQATVAAPEIGVLGYVTNFRVLDTVGLVSPVASGYYPLPSATVEGDNAIPPRLIEDLAPDAVVTLDGFARLSLFPDPAFQREYRLERRYPAPIWGSQELHVYRRNGAQ